MFIAPVVNYHCIPVYKDNSWYYPVGLKRGSDMLELKTCLKKPVMSSFCQGLRSSKSLNTVIPASVTSVIKDNIFLFPLKLVLKVPVYKDHSVFPLGSLYTQVLLY